MGQKIRLGVIFGGRSGEHDVSLMSARSILSVLDPDRYEIHLIGISRSGAWLVGDGVLEALESGRLNDLRPAFISPDPSRPGLFSACPSDTGEILQKISDLDVIFPVLHGTFGEDGTLQGLLELADVAYVGAGVLGSAVGMDKGLFKDVMRAHNIPVAESILVTRGQIETDIQAVIHQAEKLSAYPLFVKPANLGSSVGITKCRTRSDMVEGLMEAARYDRRILIERGIDAREIEVSVLGNLEPQVSVPGEIIPGADFYTYEAKYIDEGSRAVIPASLPAEISQEIRDLAKQAYQAVDCAGLARVDFLVDRGSGEVYLSEINTIPGFTRISMYPKLWEASGLPYPALIDRLIELALERKQDRDRCERSYGRES